MVSSDLGLSSFFIFFKAAPLAFRGEFLATDIPWVAKLASEKMGAAKSASANASSFVIDLTHMRAIVGAYAGGWSSEGLTDRRSAADMPI